MKNVYSFVQRTLIVLTMVSLTTTAFMQNAILDLSDAKKGILFPRLSTAERNALSTGMQDEGLMVFDTDMNSIMTYKNGIWEEMGGSIWNTNANGIFYTTGSVSIGTPEPSYEHFLNVLGSAKISRTYIGDNNGVYTGEIVNGFLFSDKFYSGYFSMNSGTSPVSDEVPAVSFFKVELKANGSTPEFLDDPNADTNPEFILYNDFGNYGFFLDFDHNAPDLRFYDEFENLRMRLKTRETSNSGPVLSMLEQEGQETVKLDGDFYTGGALRLSNESGFMRLLFSATGPSDDHPELFLIDGNNYVAMKADGADGLTIHDSNGNARTQIYRDGSIYLRDGSGVAKVKIDPDLNGNGRVITQELEITGGSDLAERFDVESVMQISPKPGMLVSIHPERVGKLILTDKPYDKAIAGVISGAGDLKPGLFMGQEGSQATGLLPVALTGRVYVYCSTKNGPIQPGDLLTSSKIPGFAMKATHKKKSQGAVIGKAMSGLKEGNGLVLVLISLQ